MTQLSHLAVLGIAKESSIGTYVVPTDYLPFTKADYEDVLLQIKDDSIRANDTVLQGSYLGSGEADWSIDMYGYPDLVGYVLRGIIGPDTVTAGVSTTLSSSSSIGATSLSVAASIAAGSYVTIDTSTNQEYAKVTAVSGSGPYTLTVTTSDTTSVGLAKAHASSVAITAASTHLFKQNPAVAPASYSLSVYDTLQTIGYSDAVFSDVSIKIDPKGSLMVSSKLKALLGVSQSAITPAFTTLEPVLGWEWVMTNAGATSNRGLSFDVSIKRPVDVIHSSSGVQSPRELFQGPLSVDGTYKAVYENQTDFNLFLQESQQPVTAAMQQPIRAGGASLSLTMSKTGWFKGKRDYGSNYVQADFSLSGIYNAVDGGAIQATLKNFKSSAF